MPPLETPILCWAMVMCYFFFLFLTRQKWCWTFPCRPSSYMYVCLYISEQDKKINTFPSKFMCTDGVFSTLKFLILLSVPLTFPPFVTKITGEVKCLCGFVDLLCPLVIFHFCFREKWESVVLREEDFFWSSILKYL